MRPAFLGARFERFCFVVNLFPNTAGLKVKKTPKFRAQFELSLTFCVCQEASCLVFAADGC